MPLHAGNGQLAQLFTGKLCASRPYDFSFPISTPLDSDHMLSSIKVPVHLEASYITNNRDYDTNVNSTSRRNVVPHGPQTV